MTEKQKIALEKSIGHVLKLYERGSVEKDEGVAVIMFKIKKLIKSK